MDAVLSGVVVRGRGYKDKVPTANVLMENPIPCGTYAGRVYDSDNLLLGDAFVFVTDYAPDIAEIYITHYDDDLLGEQLSIDRMDKLTRDDMKSLYDSAMYEWGKTRYAPDVL